MSLTGRVVGSLALGLTAGIAIYTTGSSSLLALAGQVAPLGTLWTNALLMTVVPLVVSHLFGGIVASADPRLVGRLSWRAGALFLLLVCGSAAATAVLAPALVGALPATLSFGPATAASAGAPGHVAPLAASDWLAGLIPPNPVKAAADGALLPLVVTTLLFALAVGRLPAEQRQPLARLAESIAAATRILVGWVLQLAPVGVFALALQLSARVGVAAAGVLGAYVVLVATVSVALLLPLYPVAGVLAGMSLRRFARAAAPAQAIALSSRSSLASLPALLEGAEGQLGLARSVAGFCLPLAVSTFKYCAPVTMLVGLLLAGRVYGIPVAPARLAQAAVLSVLASFAVPGVPGGGLLVAAPIFAAAGVPVEAIGVLLAADALPDMFRTLGNVTADLTVAAILGRGQAARPAASAVSTPLRVAAEA